jgi:hypothetical protein
MTRYALTLILGFAFVLTATSQGLAKDPFNQMADLIGEKRIVIQKKATKLSWSDAKAKFKKPVYQAKKTAIRAEFRAISGDQMVLIQGNTGTRVDVLGYGSGHFMWEQDGDVYEIEEYPTDNAHAPVSGIVHRANGSWAAFKLYHLKVKAAEVTGRWHGQVAFPGGAMLEVALQIATSSSNDAWCGGSNRFVEVSFIAAPNQPGSLTTCEKGLQNGTQSLSFFYWDGSKDTAYYISITGDVWYNGTVFQGQARALDLYGGNGWVEGLFSLGRPQAFAL